jgi:Zn-dependent peptidase ImmA (M78 family)
MRHGFKASAERKSVELRQALRLSPRDRLAARELAKHLKYRVVAPASIPGMTDEILAEVVHPDNGWSAATIADMEPPVILYNASHSLARQESSIMHEIAHLLEKHQPLKLLEVSGLWCRSYDDGQEEEAIWLGACLQICRDGLFWAVRRGMTNEEIAEHFVASPDMVRFRRNSTGVDQQLARLKKYY